VSKLQLSTVVERAMKRDEGRNTIEKMFLVSHRHQKGGKVVAAQKKKRDSQVREGGEEGAAKIEERSGGGNHEGCAGNCPGIYQNCLQKIKEMDD